MAFTPPRDVIAARVCIDWVLDLEAFYDEMMPNSWYWVWVYSIAEGRKVNPSIILHYLWNQNIYINCFRISEGRTKSFSANQKRKTSP